MEYVALFIFGVSFGVFLSWLLDMIRSKKYLKNEKQDVPKAEQNTKVFLTVNGVVGHEVLEDELKDLIMELGLSANPKAVDAFKDGVAVRVGNKVVQLVCG